MTASHPSQNRADGLLRILVPLISSDFFEIVLFFLRLAKKTLQSKTREGIYEVLDYHAQLELLDGAGRRVILRKRQKVRFLQDNILAWQDRAWGDGDIFADYQCSPGVAVDTYKEGHRYNILISLRETKHAGDIEEFRIARIIRNGFLGTTEDFQIDIAHRTRSFTFSCVFPKKRQPTEVSLIEQNSTRSQVLGDEHWTDLPDGRREVAWSTDRPRLFESYILRWKW